MAPIKLKCSSCGRLTESKQDHPYHAGFSDVCFLYCDRDSAVVTFSVYDPTYESLSDGKVAWDGRLNEVERRRIEENLLSCPCGGRFSFENSLRCPFCGAVLADSILKTNYFYIIGDDVDGERQNVWKSPLIQKRASQKPPVP